MSPVSGDNKSNRWASTLVNQNQRCTPAFCVLPAGLCWAPFTLSGLLPCPLVSSPCLSWLCSSSGRNERRALWGRFGTEAVGPLEPGARCTSSQQQLLCTTCVLITLTSAPHTLCCVNGNSGQVKGPTGVFTDHGGMRYSGDEFARVLISLAHSLIVGRFVTPVANKSKYTMIPSPSANCLYRLTPGEPRRFTGRQDLLSGLYHERGQSVQGAARKLCVVNGPDRVLSEGESGAW